MKNNNTPITKKEEVQKSNDNRIDEDFKGFPHTPANENLIQPNTEEDKYNADLKEHADTDFIKKEKTLLRPREEGECGQTGSTGKSHATTDFPGNKKSNDEMQSDGSANAFEGTENMFDDDEKDALSKK